MKTVSKKICSTSRTKNIKITQETRKLMEQRRTMHKEEPEYAD